MDRLAVIAVIALLAMSGSLFGLARCEREKRVEVEKALSVLEQVNAENARAQEQLQAHQEQLDKAVEAFAQDRKEIDILRRELNNGIAKVLKDNSAARDWAGSGVNPDFIRVFNESGSSCAISNDGAETCD